MSGEGGGGRGAGGGGRDYLLDKGMWEVQGWVGPDRDASPPVDRQTGQETLISLAIRTWSVLISNNSLRVMILIHARDVPI